MTNNVVTKVLIVVDTGAGWDNVVDVFYDVSKEELEKSFPYPTYVIFERTPQKFVKEHWDLDDE